MAGTLIGLYHWDLQTEEDYHRTYNSRWLVKCDESCEDGPYIAAQTPGLIQVGDSWDINASEVDLDAICHPGWKVSPYLSGEKDNLFWIDQKFSTRPIRNQNPLLEPAQVEGSFGLVTKEAARDKDGNAIKSSSHERFKGSAVEINAHTHNVSVTVNLATLPLATTTEYMNHVNSVTMWGLPARCVKLSGFGWKKVYYGELDQFTYYECSYYFDINFETFDRYILDEGSKVLRVGGVVTNPQDFIPFTVNGQPAKALLNGAGVAITDEVNQTYLFKQIYPEANLLTLPSVPASL